MSEPMHGQRQVFVRVVFRGASSHDVSACAAMLPNEIGPRPLFPARMGGESATPRQPLIGAGVLRWECASNQA